MMKVVYKSKKGFPPDSYIEVYIESEGFSIKVHEGWKQDVLKVSSKEKDQWKSVAQQEITTKKNKDINMRRMNNAFDARILIEKIHPKKDVSISGDSSKINVWHKNGNFFKSYSVDDLIKT